MRSRRNRGFRRSTNGQKSVKIRHSEALISHKNEVQQPKPTQYATGGILLNACAAVKHLFPFS
jgi:hypothetical protein